MGSCACRAVRFDTAAAHDSDRCRGLNRAAVLSGSKRGGYQWQWPLPRLSRRLAPARHVSRGSQPDRPSRGCRHNWTLADSVAGKGARRFSGVAPRHPLFKCSFKFVSTGFSRTAEHQHGHVRHPRPMLPYDNGIHRTGKSVLSCGDSPSRISVLFAGSQYLSNFGRNGDLQMVARQRVGSHQRPRHQPGEE